MDDLFLYQPELDTFVKNILIIIFIFIILSLYFIFALINMYLIKVDPIRESAAKLRYGKGVLMKVNSFYVNKLAEKCKKNIYARWKLGEILHQVEMDGGKVNIHKDGFIEIKNKDA